MSVDAYDTYTLPGANQELATELMAPPFLGWILHAVLFGIMASNGFSYVYTTLYQSDSRRTKITLWALMIGDCIAACVSIAQTLTYGTNQHRDTNTLLLGTTGLDAVPFVLCGTLAMITQLSLADRAAKFFLWRRGLRTAFMTVVCTLSVASWLASVGVTIFYVLYAAGNQSPIIQSNTGVVTVTSVWAFLSAAVDCIITVSLCWVLKKDVTGFNSTTDDILRKVIVLTMKTGIATALFALVAAILGVAFPPDALASDTYLIAFITPLSSLYVLSFIATLSARGSNLSSPQTVFKTQSAMGTTTGHTGHGGVSVQQERTVGVEDGTGWGWSDKRGNGWALGDRRGSGIALGERRASRYEGNMARDLAMMSQEPGGEPTETKIAFDV